MPDRCGCASDCRTDFRIGGIYTFSKSLDDASSIGAGATSAVARSGLGGGGRARRAAAAVVKQRVQRSSRRIALDLSAERGLSSFNQTHKFTADYLWELPFGHDKRWLTGNTPMRAIFGDWQWSGDWTIASGLPFTPRLLGQRRRSQSRNQWHASAGSWFPDNPSACRIHRSRNGSTPLPLLRLRRAPMAMRAATASSGRAPSCSIWRLPKSFR